MLRQGRDLYRAGLRPQVDIFAFDVFDVHGFDVHRFFVAVRVYQQRGI